MNGKWVSRKVEQHKCVKPVLLSDAPDAARGDQWECECGITYEVIGFDSGMQWDPFPTVIRWAVAGQRYN